MILEFVNRNRELELLNASHKKYGMVVLYGRRRIGKSNLINHWLLKSRLRGCRVQAIQGTSETQIKSIYDDLKEFFSIDIEPNTWAQLFQLIESIKGPFVLALDEFPYLVEADSSVPSLFQKWIDNKKKKDLQLMFMGSSQHMMYSVFLEKSSPLFGRAYREIKLEPMGYENFCEALNITRSQKSFELFTLVGGVPKYWEYIDPNLSLEKNIENLFFSYSAFLENEPQKLLKDERIEGLIPLSVLDCIGRGTHKPSDIAARMGVNQSHLSRTFNALLDGHFLKKDICFGESSKNPKKVLYQIQDYAFCFWYQIYTPYQTRWSRLTDEEQRHLLQLYFSRVFEEYVRKQFNGGQRYWESIKIKNTNGKIVTKGIELDVLYFDENNPKQLVVIEVKYKKLTSKQRTEILTELKQKWTQTKLAPLYNNPIFKVIDLNDIL